MNNGADPSAATAAIAAIANGGGNGTAAITMEQLLAALGQVVGNNQTNSKIMKNKETQTGREREDRWDRPVAKSKVGGNDRALSVRNYRAKRDAISGSKTPSNDNNKLSAKGEVTRKAEGKQKTPPSKKATEEDTREDNSRGKEANGKVNGDAERCDLVRGQSLPPFLVCS